MTCKSSVKQIFVDFKARIEKSTVLKVRALQTDNGGKFVVPIPFLRYHGIMHQRACPYAHQKIGQSKMAPSCRQLQVSID